MLGLKKTESRKIYVYGKQPAERRFIMGTDKTKNEIEIRQISGGYASGNLYEGNTENNIDKRISIFDKNTYNFHLCSEDKEIANKIRDEIGSLREKVMDCLIKEKGCEEVSGHTIPKEKNEENMIYISKGAGSGGGTRELNGLFKFILAMKNGVIYELNFMRFFIDRENKVNCILKAIQFDRCMGEFVNKSIEGCCDICYPKTNEAQSEKELNEIQEERKEKSFCYNPDVSFFDGAKLIAEAFKKFIDDCDKWSHANNEQIFDKK